MSDCFVKKLFDPILWLPLLRYQKKLGFYLIFYWNLWLVYRAGVNIITYGKLSGVPLNIFSSVVVKIGLDFKNCWNINNSRSNKGTIKQYTKIANIYWLFAWLVSYLWPLKTVMGPDHVWLSGSKLFWHSHYVNSIIYWRIWFCESKA